LGPEALPLLAIRGAGDGANDSKKAVLLFVIRLWLRALDCYLFVSCIETVKDTHAAPPPLGGLTFFIIFSGVRLLHGIGGYRIENKNSIG
jgi:hypothetical protein